MKKLIICFILSAITVTAHARTCPRPDELFYFNGHDYILSPPSGWQIVKDERTTKHRNIEFRVAAWGDHKHPLDTVRCFYYRDSFYDRIQIETTEFMDASHFPYWHNDDNKYFLCSGSTVEACPFT